MQYVLTLEGTTFGTEVVVLHSQDEVGKRLAERMTKNPTARPSMEVRS